MNDPAALSPSVGIFWGIRGAGGLALVTDATMLAEAEPYGEFLTHPCGHHDVWLAWQRLGPRGLAARGLPAAIAWNEYETFPRGRIVFDTTSRRFTLYADRRLLQRATVARLVAAFALQDERWLLRSDAHYRSGAS